MRKQIGRVRLGDLLREDSGDYSGEPSFQGGPLGFGGRQQLANPVVAPGLQDPNEKKYYPFMPSLYPALFAQEKDEEVYDGIEAAEDMPLTEYSRARGDILYKDLPGGPAMNTLEDPVDHVPHGEDQEGKLDTDAYGVQHLIPNGRDDIDPGEQFMVDDLEDSDVVGLRLDKSNIMASPNDFTVTSPSYRGKNLNPPSTVFDQLVKPVDWIGMETGENQPYMPGQINAQDFEMRTQQAGNIVKPVIWVGNGDDRNNNQIDKPYLKPDSYLDETIMATKNKTTTKPTPSSKDTAKSSLKPEPTGNGLGTVQKRYDNFPGKGKDDKTEPFADKTVAGVAGATTSANASNGNEPLNNSWDIANLSDAQVKVLQEAVLRKVIAKIAAKALSPRH
jgi:hypothetical protein